MPIRWTFFKGKKILHIDYTGMNEASMLKQMESYFTIIATESDVRQLSNFGDVRLSRSFFESAKQLAKAKPDGIRVKIALIGISRYQKALVFTFNYHTKAHAQVFDSEQEAMEWLAHD